MYNPLDFALSNATLLLLIIYPVIQLASNNYKYQEHKSTLGLVHPFKLHQFER